MNPRNLSLIIILLFIATVGYLRLSTHLRAQHQWRDEQRAITDKHSVEAGG